MIGTAKPLGSEEILPAYFSIDDLAERWRCSRGSVYNWIRGETVVDFARPGHKGKKLVPRIVVQRIEQKHAKCLR
jgi:hypothetical protein